MTTESTKIQKLSDKVYQILEEQGFTKLFNFEDYRFFKMQSTDKPNPAQWIAEQFISWNSHELSDFADYEF
ncbi:hypothetical protein [Chryseobacterium sp. MP_3.2]|uniref:hypothetical protein n=1 Tax=Chryseobacterium sp. MP_3.2 TaxID=3071712 RepID=UPI002DF88810|nr:hypothetical protein [Chryseobacterium sp. MP_3.2]